VVVRDDSIEVRGWVHVDDLAPGSPGDRAWADRALYGTGGIGHVRDGNVPGGTRLHAEPEGPVVGQLLEARWVAGSPETAWVPVDVTTPWGDAVTWLTLD
jgi:hypothetical protein